MSFPRYPEYKDSGVEWLGEVPAHWEVTQLRYAIRGIESGTSVNATDLPAEVGEIGVLKTSCVYRGFFEPAENKRVVPEEFDRVSCPLKKDSLIVSRMNTPDLIGAAGLVNSVIDGIYLPDRLWQVLFNERVMPGFMYLWASSAIYRAQVQVACAGTSASMQNLSQDSFRGFWLVLPPRREQAEISDFLKAELRKIDELVLEQEKLIALLKEKRQAVISHAVTKGLDPSVPMKDSGIEWLGEVPAHWEVMQFRRRIFIAEGQVDPAADPYRDMVLIAPNHVESGAGRLFDQETAAEQSAESGKYVCNAGDVIYSKIRPALRKACLAPCDCLCSADMYPLRPHAGLLGEFLLWYLLSEHFSSLAVLESERVAMPKINRETLNEVMIVVPPTQEQRDIASYIRQVVASLDALGTGAEIAVGLLKERRAALISAAVTGKIDLASHGKSRS